MMDHKVWIILATVLGFLVLTLVVTLGLFLSKRSKRKVRSFSLRAVTPLDDAEFESWRRPSEYTKRPEKYGIKPTQPAVVRSTRTPNMFEKELALYEFPRSPSPQSPSKSHKSSSSIQKPEPVRRKSSVSLADRPPTPYSPMAPSSDFTRRGSHVSHASRGSNRHVHYPSMSEASAFRFNFDYDDQLKRPLSLSYGPHEKV
ncbi:hypothetical protein P154DRAFT_124115 [Amniculicola lignicola CBS 123094]|uniref:Uncharacterized protein n=1 Tax=Amniculicola lignicola CBS 123094 TaxID=1392246 RepID=A0A6A5WQ03_9PLEO|nr:hypothetical protein P154DRAFT_124115 [Amniculicola lignicola CBS 123094]